MKNIILLSCFFISAATLAANANGTASGWQPAQTTEQATATVSAANKETPKKSEPSSDTVYMPEKPPPLPDAAMNYAEQITTPLSPNVVKRLRHNLDQVQRSSALPPVTAAPRIRSLTVRLEPGSSLPMMQILPNYPGTLNFTDQNGNPWPVAAPPVNGNPAGFLVNYLPDTPSVVVQAKRVYDTGSLSVYLQGLTVPVIISLSSGEPGNQADSQPTDSRLDLRVPGVNPTAKKPIVISPQKVALYDNILQAFLDGIPPADAVKIHMKGSVPDTNAWQIADDLYLRSHYQLRDEFDSTLSSADGTHVWKLPVTPYVTFSVSGHNRPLILEIQ